MALKFNSIRFFAAIRYPSSLFRAVVLCLLLMMSCTSDQKKAQGYLSDAKKAYERGDYSYAKNQIDSIKIKFPKAFDEINEGFTLLQDIRIAENRRNIAFCDSALQANQIILKEMLQKFDYERDAEYQEIGYYIPKLYPLSQSMDRNTVRSGVSEKGVLYLESILAGNPVRHKQIRVSLPDGEFAETLPVTSDGFNYRISTSERTYEIVRYSGKDENGVAQFIDAFRNAPVTVTFIGNRNISHRLSDKEKQAVSQSYELSVILSDIEKLKFERERSEALLRYLETKKTD